VHRAARQKEVGNKVTTEASCCKLFASEMVSRFADKAVKMRGGAGYISDYAVDRLYRDVGLFRLYEGTSQFQQMMIARNMITDIQ
jgi:acyl-CoA dehydrogenase